LVILLYKYSGTVWLKLARKRTDDLFTQFITQKTFSNNKYIYITSYNAYKLNWHLDLLKVVTAGVC